MRASGCPGGCTCRDSRVSCRAGPSEALLNALSQLPQLTELSLAGCSISNFDNLTIDGLVQLRTLDLSRNVITQLSDDASFNNTDLKVLDMSRNLIRTIDGSPFRTLCSLEVLNLSGNAIDCIPANGFCGLDTLLSLDLSVNNITALQDDAFEPLSSLQQLNLSKNQVATLSESCFNNLQRLQQLDLSWNKLTSMAPGTLQALPSLSRLMIAGNLALGGGSKDSALLVGTGKRLQTLDASRTGLEHVPAALTHSVRTLRLAGNSIRFVRCGDLDSYPLLQLLDLTTNLLEETEEDALGRLEMLVVLYLTDNKLHAIPRSLPDKLKILHLEFNHIEQIVSGDLLGLPKLEVLLLNDNEIKVVQEGAFNQMTALITLDLSRNPISILPGGTLAGPSRLQVLRLSSITIETPAEDMTFPIPSPEHLVRLDLSYSPGLARQLLADKAALAAFRELQELNLTNTELVNIRSDLLHYLPQLRDLHITGNRLNCSGMLWLALWMRVQDQPEHRQVICVSPPELYGTLVVDLQDTDVELTTVQSVTTTIVNLTTIPEAITIYSDKSAGKRSNDSTATEMEMENTTKSLREKKNEMVRTTSSGIVFSSSAVTAASENRSDTSDATTDLVHLSSIGIESPTDATKTTVTDGHIVEINSTDNRPPSEPSNYTTRAEQSQANVQRTAGMTTAASRDNERLGASSPAQYANQSDNPELNKPDRHDSELSQDLFISAKRNASEDTTEAGNATSGQATAEMSMYSSRREIDEEDGNKALVHPGMLILLAVVAGTALALSTLISHVRKRRKRLADGEGYYSRQHDIEVNSLPGFSELW